MCPAVTVWETQYGNEFRMHDFHFITDNPWKGQEKEIDITFKIRHTPDFTKGKLIQEGGEAIPHFVL